METLEPFNIIYQTAEDGLGDTVKPRLMEADADLEKVLVIDDRDTPLTLADERIARAIRENNARLVIIDPVQAFLGTDVDMNRANEVRPIFRSLGDIAQATGCAIVLIGHLNKAAGTQSTYRGLGSIDITAAVRSLLFIGKLKDSPTTRVLIHEKSSLAPPGQSLAFSLDSVARSRQKMAMSCLRGNVLVSVSAANLIPGPAASQHLGLLFLTHPYFLPLPVYFST